MLYIILAAVAVILVFFIICYVCYRMAFYVSPKENKDPHILLEGEQYLALKDETLALVDGALAIPYTDVYTTSQDALRLHGRYYEVKKGAPVEIMMHGYRSIAMRDFCGALQFTLATGHNVLVVDQRAHGESEGRALAFGVLERYDCLAWANFAREKFGADTKIVLVGVSMGAATVLMASDLPLPENVVGIVADSAYSSPKAIIRKVIGKDMHLPVSISYVFAYLGGRIFGGFDLHKSSAIESVKNCKLPVLLFHGEDDRFVPCEMCGEIAAACASDVTVLTVPNAGHGLEYLIDKEAYMTTLHVFLKKIGTM